MTLNPFIELNSVRTGRLVIIEARGRFFDNVKGYLFYSGPILEVGLQKAF
jgi:hypothetical protein